MKDKLIEFGYLRELGEVCEICDYNHSFNRCPFTFLLPNSLKIINEFNKSYP